MKLSKLQALLEGKLSASAFRNELSAWLPAYDRGLAEKGRLVPVVVTDDCEFLLTNRHVLTLCQLFIAGDLTSRELSYTADALQLSDGVDFAPGTADTIAEFTDPEINGEFTVGRAAELVNGGAS